ncbi:N-formylglutamate deformylase [Pacificibacter maritimus]|uniref:N-formylglutamate deformylase n=1 Tax=Pacificibacter maritimus TaxID=762213 RepID=A0A3N4UT80_9RHOB|nr:N-formylglutamate amidohydrolase [Pacificibacter maritimus]RPE64890.1 N-formylglutamate deformylase [Pacificibacter maritimus]
MSTVPYRLYRPQKRRSFVVFSSPHSGCYYPAEMLERSVLDPITLRSSEDAYVDVLFENTPKYGATFLSAVYPRAWLDLNRHSDELDPAVIEGVSIRQTNARILSGLGVIPRVVANGRSIYSGKITRAQADMRIAQIWRPYHLMLETLLHETKTLFGQSLLIDCHSMPREALRNIKTATGRTPQIVIGDREGTSASADLVRDVEAAFRAEGFEVLRNIPFAGAYVCKQYGHPARNQHCIQVEIDRSLYMNEKTLERSADFEDVKSALGRAAQTIAAFDVGRVPLAAE